VHRENFSFETAVVLVMGESVPERQHQKSQKMNVFLFHALYHSRRFMGYPAPQDYFLNTAGLVFKGAVSSTTHRTGSFH